MSTAGGDDRPRWEPQRIPTGNSGSSSGGPVQDAGPRKSSTLVKLGITAAVVGGGVWMLSAMNDDEEPTHAAVCVDQETNTRVDDDRCDDDRGGGGHFGWFFFAYGHSAPRIGAPVTGGGSYSVPQGSYVRGGVPREGGVVSASSVKGGTKTTVRGGFGGGAKGHGG